MHKSQISSKCNIAPIYPVPYKCKNVYYSAYRNSVNIAFLRLFLYVQTNRRINIRINTSVQRLIGDIFSLQRYCHMGCDDGNCPHLSICFFFNLP